MTKAVLYIVILWMGLAAALRVQAQNLEIVQFSGFIQATGTDIAVPYVTITNKSYGNQVFMANHEGYFSFVAHKGDVIEFTSIGYDKVEVTIPNVPGDKYTTGIQMTSKVEELPVVTVGPPLPWASIEEFTAAFLNLNASGDDLLAARRNLSPDALASLSSIIPRSAEEIQNFNNVQRHVGMTNRNMHQNAYTPFMNPFAWGQLINQIKRGDFSRKKLKY